MTCVNAGTDRVHLARPSPYGVRVQRCATCERAHRKAAKVKAKASRVERVYSLTAEQSEAIWEAQGRRCAICRRPVLVRAAAHDHDHSCCPGPTSCGKCVRGRLCKPCNSMLAQARDDVNVFIRAARYLLDPPGLEVLRKLRETEE